MYLRPPNYSNMTLLSQYESLISTIEDILNTNSDTTLIRNHIETFRVQQGVKSIKQIVAEFYNLPDDKISSKIRLREVVEPRQVAMYFYKKYTNLSLVKIGKLFSDSGHVFSHCTTLYSISKVNDYLDSDNSFKARFEALDSMINNQFKIAV